MGDDAFLSFRLPAAQRDRVKSIAAERGTSVQGLMGGLVRRLLEEEARRPPLLSELLTRLRAQRPALQERGVAHLWLFGSAVRGEARPDSDIDLIAEFDPEARVSLTAVARLGQDLSERLGAPVDLAEWRTLRPHVREAAEREAVAVF